ncbi:DUF4974 domain-containing protein [Telmatocola sphagniphila]|uniref:DUF4974 domain-containing protein n=1 Tax=Telmatocola sphagniphila TaxID=1123043 RepID=A0A8E6B958_9BACT|nr:hypothetical protein [Telmatocola sphagniphila]QVL33677.1 DUF4974 domain-containing protein [Telmatocola sphagniphila]
MRIPILRPLVLVLAILGMVSLTPVQGSYPPPEKNSAKSKIAAPKVKEKTPEELQKLLSENVKCSFLEMELKAVLSDLSQQTGAKIKFDTAFLSQQPGDMEGLTVSLETDGMPLRKALRKLTLAYQLSFGVVGDTIWVSSEEGLAARQMRQYIPISCKETPLSDLIKTLSSKYSVNMVLDLKARKSKASETPITLELEEATLETILRLATEMAGLKPVRIGGVIYITSEERADKLRDGDTLVPQIPMIPENRNDGQPGIAAAAGVMNGVPVAPQPIAPVAPPVENPPAGP